jgi:hypothetical protein
MGRIVVPMLRLQAADKAAQPKVQGEIEVKNGSEGNGNSPATTGRKSNHKLATPLFYPASAFLVFLPI